MPEHQKVQKRSHNIQSIQGKRSKHRKKVLQHKGRCGRSEEKLIAMRSDSGSCPTRSTRTKWSMQKRQPNFRGCRQERKERQQRFASGGLLLGDHGGTDFRFGNGSGKV